MRSLFVLLVFAFGSQVKAGDAPITGAEKPVQKNGYAALSVKTDPGDLVGWTVHPKPVQKDVVEGTGKLFFGGVPGTKYEVTVTIVNFGENGQKKRFDQGSAEVTFEGTLEPAPPPKKKDEPLTPVDAEAKLLADLRVAYDLEPDEDKPLVVALYGVYVYGAEQVDSSDTFGNLFGKMAKKAGEDKIAGKLQIVQKVVQKYLTSVLPSKGAGSTVLTGESRRQAKDVFLVVAGALKKLLPK